MIPYLENCKYYVYSSDRFGNTIVTKLNRLRDLKAFLLSKHKSADFNSPYSILHDKILVIDLYRIYNDYNEDFVYDLCLKNFNKNIVVYDEYDRLVNHNLLIYEMIEIITKFWYKSPFDKDEGIRMMDTSNPEWRKYMNIEDVYIRRERNYCNGSTRFGRSRNFKNITQEIISKNVAEDTPQFKITVNGVKTIYRKLPIPRIHYRKHHRIYHTCRGLTKELSTGHVRTKRVQDFREIYDWDYFHKNDTYKNWKKYHKGSKNWDRPYKIRPFVKYNEYWQKGFAIGTLMYKPQVGSLFSNYKKDKRSKKLECKIKMEENKPIFDCSDIFDSNLIFEIN